MDTDYKKEPEDSMPPEEVKRMQREFLANRAMMMQGFRQNRDIIANILENGVETAVENRVARALCAMVLSDLEFEDAVLKDKAGEILGDDPTSLDFAPPEDP